MTAIIMGAYDYGGAALTGYKKDPEIDEFERKQALRKNRRIPIEQTIAEIGEGRGVWYISHCSTSALIYTCRNIWSRI